MIIGQDGSGKKDPKAGKEPPEIFIKLPLVAAYRNLNIFSRIDYLEGFLPISVHYVLGACDFGTLFGQ